MSAIPAYVHTQILTSVSHISFLDSSKRKQISDYYVSRPRVCSTAFFSSVMTSKQTHLLNTHSIFGKVTWKLRGDSVIC